MQPLHSQYPISTNYLRSLHDQHVLHLHYANFLYQRYTSLHTRFVATTRPHTAIPPLPYGHGGRGLPLVSGFPAHLANREPNERIGQPDAPTRPPYPTYQYTGQSCRVGGEPRGSQPRRSRGTDQPTHDNHRSAVVPTLVNLQPVLLELSVDEKDSYH